MTPSKWYCKHLGVYELSMNVPDYPGMAGPASACASPIFPSGRQTGKAPRCRTFPHRSCKRGLIWGVEVLVQKVFHLPSPCAIFYQLRLIALFVNVMNLYNNGLIMTMIMLIMMSLILAGIALFEVFPLYHQKSLPTPCKIVITNIPNIPELKGPQCIYFLLPRPLRRSMYGSMGHVWETWIRVGTITYWQHDTVTSLLIVQRNSHILKL